MRKLTILTLMGGRWHSLDPYLQCLEALECDPKEITLLWFSNARTWFVNLIERLAPCLEEKGFEVRIIHDPTLEPSDNVFTEGGPRVDMHVNTITVLYNTAWQYVKTNDVLFLEDDVLVPSHALGRLTGDLEKKPKAAMIASCVFDRHAQGAPAVFAWRILKGTAEEGGKRKTQYVSAPVQTPWGLQPVSCAGFSCSLIRRSRLPRQLQGALPFKTRHPDKEFAAFSGCDIVFSLELQKYGRQVFCDFDVRPLHLDSKGMVH